jgi:hypothetical protein
MKNKIIFSLLLGIVLVTSVSAYWTERTYYDDCLDFGNCEPRDYGLYLQVGCDGCYHDYYDYNEFAPGYPRLAYGYSPGYYTNRYNYRYPNRYYNRNDDWKFRRTLTHTIWDAAKAYDDWQYNIQGKTSGEAYGSGENKASSWSNKRAYTASDPYRESNYYSKPRWDPEEEHFNWRY